MQIQQIFNPGLGVIQRRNTHFQDLNLGVQFANSPGQMGVGQNIRGFGIDLDGDGQFQGNKDGILAFDINRDGRINQGEINESNRRLKLFTAKIMTTDQFREKQQLLQQYDRDGDGKLNSWELQSAGAKILTDRNQDGQFSSGEAQNIGSLRTAAGGFSLEQLDLRNNNSVVHRNGNAGYDPRQNADGWGGRCGIDPAQFPPVQNAPQGGQQQSYQSSYLDNLASTDDRKKQATDRLAGMGFKQAQLGALGIGFGMNDQPGTTYYTRADGQRVKLTPDGSVLPA